MRLLYFAPFSWGGLAEYAYQQAHALAREGVEVTVMCPVDEQSPWYRHRPDRLACTLMPVLKGWQVRSLPALARKMVFAHDLLQDAHALRRTIRRHHFQNVLFAAYSEHFAPLWTGSLRSLARDRHTIFGAVVHDPVRTVGFGPRWWHRWSVAAKYSFLREAFVHSPLILDTVRPMPTLRTTVIPQGIYEAPPTRLSRSEWRACHGLSPDAKVLLSFGHVRDSKNLDLILHALQRLPTLHLVVAGREQSSGQKSVTFYQDMARELGVEHRCRWLTGFIPNEEVGDIFNASDLLLLTYNSSFRSASAVLNVAINFRLPCIASGGEGGLCQAVHQYGLGMWIEPDSMEALIVGLAQWLNGVMPAPRWEDYKKENSWQRNAEIVAERMGAPRPVG